jgi:hypothetical protein
MLNSLVLECTRICIQRKTVKLYQKYEYDSFDRSKKYTYYHQQCESDKHSTIVSLVRMKDYGVLRDSVGAGAVTWWLSRKAGLI